MRNLCRFLILKFGGEGGGPFFEDGMRNLLGFLTKGFRGRGEHLFGGGDKTYIDLSLCMSVKYDHFKHLLYI